MLGAGGINMLIRDLERKTGLERATIRFYERESLITPTRCENGYREYAESDVQTLLKIKLLRQLGMSLDRIKELQQGSMDFTDALNEQIQALDQQIQSKTRAKEVCIQMRDDGVSYGLLDAQRYLYALSRPSQNTPAWTPKPVPEFQERLRQERHPFRRFFARFLDAQLLILLIQFVLYVVMRIRPAGTIPDGLIQYGAYFLMVPIAALWIHLTGTTPGKWIMGIRVDSCDGGRLGWQEALEREWNVLRYGYGFHIPLWSLWRLYKSWQEDRDDGGNEWNDDSEYIHENRNWRHYAGLACMIVLLFGLFGFTLQDMFKPRFRGAELTIQQFTEDYNNYIYLTNEEVYYEETLNSDGEWNTSSGNGVVIYIGGEAVNPNCQFQYELSEEGYITAITYENAWTSVGLLEPLMGNRFNAAAALLLAQDEIGIKEYLEFIGAYQKATQQKNGQFIYKNIEISWKIETNNCSLINDRYYMSIGENDPSSLSLWFQISLIELSNDK